MGKRMRSLGYNLKDIMTSRLSQKLGCHGLFNALAIISLFLQVGLASVTSNTGSIKFDPEGSNLPKMTLNSTGLGIGVSPSTNLHVSGNTVIINSLTVGSSMVGSANLNVVGSMGMSSLSVSSDETLGNETLVFANSASGNLVLTLPDASSVEGRHYWIKKVSSPNVVSIVGAQSIESFTQINLIAGKVGSLHILSNGTQWYTLSQSSDAVGVSSPGGELWVYEGFQYGAAGSGLRVQPDFVGGDIDATGLSGTWADLSGGANGGDLKMLSGSLSFGDLSTSGNQIQATSTSTNDRLVRTISANITTSSELWFSVLFQNTATDNGGFALTNEDPANYQYYLITAPATLEGIGWSVPGGTTVTPYAWGGGLQVTGTASVSATTLQLFVGKVVWDSGAGGKDEYSLYTYNLNGGSITGGSLTQIGATLEVDIDQESASGYLDVLNLSRKKGNIYYDEIRIGSSLEMVTPN